MGDGGWFHTGTSSCHFVLIRLVTMEPPDYREEDRSVLLKAYGYYGEHSRLPKARAQDPAQTLPPAPTQPRNGAQVLLSANHVHPVAGWGLLQVGEPTQQPGLARPKLSAKVARACCPRQGPLPPPPTCPQ